MQGMWKNIFIFLIFKAVAQILPGMSGKAETLTLRPVIPKRLTGAIHEGSVCYRPPRIRGVFARFSAQKPEWNGVRPICEANSAWANASYYSRPR